MKRRCAYCGSKTGVTPLQGLRSSWLSRAAHSPLRAEIPPLCEAVQQGIAATRRTKALSQFQLQQREKET